MLIERKRKKKKSFVDQRKKGAKIFRCFVTFLGKVKLNKTSRGER